ncbi:MAG: DUF3795 domain-containing protein [Dehalococcoidia bacterium]|nr:DUF3795 domain-containing protein [Dehalococcoidia bacterium]
MKRSSYSIGACGLICEGCEILEASSNPELARSNADWLQQHGYPQVRPEDVHCSGCKGDRATHWSADCWILLCCVDKKGLEFCYECQDFPCSRLNEWAKGNKRYEKAVGRLKEMKEGKESTP